MRPILLALPLVSVLALLGCSQAQETPAAAETAAANEGTGTPVTLTNVPVDLRAADPKDPRIDGLIYRGGVSVVPGDHEEEFGGLSGFKISPDGTRFVAVTDQGHWATGALTYKDDGTLQGMADVRLSPMLNAEGKPLEGKTDADSEGLAFDDPFALTGDAYVSYERDHRILRYGFSADSTGARGARLELPAAVTALGNNEGLEVIAALGNGRLLAIAEQGVGDTDSPAWIIDTTGKAAPVAFTVRRTLPFAMTDATLLPDGRLLTLERRFDVMTGPGAQLRLFDVGAMSEGATVDGTLVATLFSGVTVDNMEGLAARKTEDGKTLIYVVSDDNFQRPLQRTLVMMFELVE